MERFDLQRAINGDPVITRNGEDWTFIKIANPPIGNCDVIGSCNTYSGYWKSNGRFLHKYDSQLDLFMKS